MKTPKRFAFPHARILRTSTARKQQIQKFILATTLASAGLALAADVTVPPNFTINSDVGTPVFTEGLLEGYVYQQGPTNTTTANPANSSPELGLRMAHIREWMAGGSGVDAWQNGKTWIYTGQVNTGPNGIISFAANNDDGDWLKINGTVYLDDGGWNTAAAATVTGLTPNTWVDFEYRVADFGFGGQGPSGENGQAGPTGEPGTSANWSTSKGAVMSWENEGRSIDAAAYTGGLPGLENDGRPQEDGDGTPELFRFQSGFAFEDNFHVTGSGTITIDGNNATVAEPSLAFETTGATLTVNDGSGVHKTLFLSNGTTLGNANGQSNTINGTADVRLGKLLDGGFNNLTLTHTGPGKLILDSTSGNNADGATIAAGVGGRVFVTDNGAATLGALAITGTGGLLDIGSNGGATYDTAISVGENGTLAHTRPGNDTIGGATGITIANGKTLTVDNTGGRLTFAGAVTGEALQKNGGSPVRFNGNVNLASFTNTTGLTTLNGNATVGTATNSGGTTIFNGATTLTNATVNGGRMEINGSVNLGSVPSISSGATLALLSASGNVVPGAIAVPSGTLEVMPGALGTSSLNLSGGALSIVGNTAGLTAYLFSGDDFGANQNFGTFGSYTDYFAGRGTTVGQNGLAVVTSTATGGVTELSFNPDGSNDGENGSPLDASERMYRAYGFTNANNIVSRFVGNITIEHEGDYTFGTTSDDGSMLFINGNAVANNNFYQGMNRREGTVRLTAGSHRIDIGFYEGGGGNGFIVDWAAAGTENGAGDFGQRTLENAVLSSGGALNFTNQIAVTQDSTINILGGSLARTVASGITVDSGKRLSTTGGQLSATVLNMTNGTIDASNVFVVNNFNGGGSPVSITKIGTGVLALDPTVPHLQDGGTFIVQEGQVGLMLGGPHVPLGNASVTFAGGGVALSSKGGDQTFALPVFNGNGSVTARQIGSGVAGPVNINLTGNLGVSSGQTITLGSQDNYTLRLGGSTSGTGTDGSGTVAVSGGNVVTTSNTALQGLAVSLAPTSGTATLRMESSAPSIASLSNTGSGSVVVGTGSGAATLTLAGSQPGISTYSGTINNAGGSTVQVVKSGTGTQRLQGALNVQGITAEGGVLQLSRVAAGTAPITLAGGTIQFADRGLELNIYDTDPRANNSQGYNMANFGTAAAARAYFAALGSPAVATNSANNNNQVIDYRDFPTVNLNGAPFRIHGSNDTDTIEAIFNGSFYAPTPGLYTFHPRSDDGTAVYINGTLLVHNNFPQGYEEGQSARDRSVFLSAGYHPITMFFNEGDGGAGMSVDVTTPDSSRRRLNNNELFITDLAVNNAINVSATGGTIDPVNSTLTLNGAVTGAGTVSIGRGTVVANANVNVGGITVTPGATLRAGNAGLTTANGTTVQEGGTLQVTGGAVNGGFTFNGGVLHAVNGNNNFGTTAITGSAIDSSGITANALQGRGYLRTGLGINNTGGVFGLLQSTPDATVPLTGALNFTPTAQADIAFADFFGLPAIQTNNAAFTAAFTGRYTANASGEHIFGFSQHDDSAAFWVDLNQNGIFEQNGSAGSELLSSAGCCGSTTNVPVTLVGGQSYNVFVAVEDTGGESGLEAHFTASGGANATIDPSAQAGTWSFGTPTGGANLRLEAGTTIQAGSLVNGRIVAFTGNNATLNLDSAGLATTSTAEALTNVGAQNVTLNLGANNAFNVSRLTLEQNSVFTKTGSGLLAVSNQSLGNGSLLRINGGTVRLDGAVTAGIAGANNGSVEINATATLDIRGTITGAVSLNGGRLVGSGIVGAVTATASGGTIAPGTSPGIMTTASISANGSTVFEFEIGSGVTPGTALAGVNYDQIVVTGSPLDLGGATLSLPVVSQLHVNDVFTLILNNGSDTDPGTFGALWAGMSGPTSNQGLINLPGGYQVQISYFDDASTPGIEFSGGNDVSLLVTIPEPSSAAILMGGLAMLTGLQRFRRRSA